MWPLRVICRQRWFVDNKSALVWRASATPNHRRPTHHPWQMQNRHLRLHLRVHRSLIGRLSYILVKWILQRGRSPLTRGRIRGAATLAGQRAVAAFASRTERLKHYVQCQHDTAINPEGLHSCAEQCGRSKDGVMTEHAVMTAWSSQCLVVFSLTTGAEYGALHQVVSGHDRHNHDTKAA